MSIITYAATAGYEPKPVFDPTFFPAKDAPQAARQWFRNPTKDDGFQLFGSFLLVLISVTASAGAFSASLLAGVITSLVCLPFLAIGVAGGSVYSTNIKAHKAFTKHHLAAATATASQLHTILDQVTSSISGPAEPYRELLLTAAEIEVANAITSDNLARQLQTKIDALPGGGQAAVALKEQHQTDIQQAQAAYNLSLTTLAGLQDTLTEMNAVTQLNYEKPLALQNAPAPSNLSTLNEYLTEALTAYKSLN